MTDISATGIGSDPTAAAAAAAAVNAGNPAGGDGSGSNGSGAPAATNPTASPEQGQLEWAKAKGWLADDGSYKTADVLKSYQNLEKQLGSTSRVPDEKAAPEEWDKFHKSRGWPGDVKGYEFKLPENLPADLPYNQKMAETFKEWANSERLPVKTASSLHDKFTTFQAEQYKADIAAFEQSLTDSAKASHATFTKEWGDPGTETYNKNTEAARKAFSDPKLQGLEAKLKAAGLLTKDGNFTNFEIGHLLASHGQQFLNGSFVQPNGQPRAGENPFMRTLPDGKPNPSFNMTESARLLKQNPSEARRLILAAGQSLADYSLT